MAAKKLLIKSGVHVFAMLIIYELKKIFSTKYITILLLILLALNAIVCSVTVLSNPSKKIPDEYIESLLEEYNISPDSVDEAYERIKEQYNEQMTLLYGAISEGKEEFEMNFSRSYIDYKDFTDYDLFTTVYSYIEYPSRFDERIQRIIDTATINANLFKQSSDDYDSFSYKYQLQIIDKYSYIRDNLNIPTVYPKGWDVYLQYSIINIFILLFTVILASNVFIQEKACGFHNVLRISRNGRLKTVIAKVIASYITIILVVIIFVISTIAVIFFTNGFSDPFLPVQVFEKLSLCPYSYSVFDCVLLNFFLKIISSLLYLNIVMLISLTYQYAIPITTGIIILVANFIRYIIPSSNPFKYLNVFSITSANDVILRYRAVPLFNNSIDILLFALTLYAALILCTIILTMVLGSKALPKVKKIKSGISKSFFDIKERSNNKYSNVFPSLILFELQKKKILLIVIALITFIKLIYNTYINTPIVSANELLYKEYMATLEGEFTLEKKAYIVNESNYISEVLASEKQIRMLYDLGELSREEYISYLKKYYYCQPRSEIIKRIYEHANYLETIQNSTGVKTYFIYDTGILAYINRNLDPFLILIIILLGTNKFIPEYIQNSSKKPVYALLRTTKYGRKRLYYIKTIITLLLSCIIYIIYQIIDWITISSTYYIPIISANLISIEIYQKTLPSVTINQYIMFLFFYGMFGVCLISLFCSVLSQLLKKTLYVYAVSLISLLSPHAIIETGVAQISFFNPLLAVMPDKLYRMILSSNTANPILLLLFPIILSFLVLLITSVSYKDFCL